MEGGGGIATGLLGSGANGECISIEGVRQLGIQHLMEDPRSQARGLGGRVPVLGEIHTTLYVGEIPYTQRFQVLEEIEDYDMIIGTRFFKEVGILETFEEQLKQVLGSDKIERGF